MKHASKKASMPPMSRIGSNALSSLQLEEGKSLKYLFFLSVCMKKSLLQVVKTMDTRQILSLITNSWIDHSLLYMLWMDYCHQFWTLGVCPGKVFIGHFSAGATPWLCDFEKVSYFMLWKDYIHQIWTVATLLWEFSIELSSLGTGDVYCVVM